MSSTVTLIEFVEGLEAPLMSEPQITFFYFKGQKLNWSRWKTVTCQSTQILPEEPKTPCRETAAFFSFTNFEKCNGSDMGALYYWILHIRWFKGEGVASLQLQHFGHCCGVILVSLSGPPGGLGAPHMPAQDLHFWLWIINQLLRKTC